MPVDKKKKPAPEAPPPPKAAAPAPVATAPAAAPSVSTPGVDYVPPVAPENFTVTHDPHNPNFRPGEAMGPSDYFARRRAMKKAHAPKIEERAPGVPTITGIPRGSRITIVALPGRQEIVSGLEVFREYSPTLDPGAYAYTIVRDVDPPQCTTIQRWTGEFFAHLTPHQFERLQYLRPKMAKGILTTDGARWVCGFMGCAQRFTSLTQIIQHEGEHFGRDLLNEPDETFDMTAEEIEAAGLEHAKAQMAAKLRQRTTPIQPEP